VLTEYDSGYAAYYSPSNHGHIIAKGGVLVKRYFGKHFLNVMFLFVD